MVVYMNALTVIKEDDIQEVINHFKEQMKKDMESFRPVWLRDGPGDFLFCQSCEELEKCQKKILTKCCKP